MLAIYVISLALLVSIAVSDFKTRQIPVLLLSGELVVSLLIALFQQGGYAIKIGGINLVLLALQIFVLYLWIRLRNQHDALWSKFGPADLFILVIAAFNFSILNYLFFILITSLTAVLVWGIGSLMGKEGRKTIPFAGFIAIGLMGIRLLQIAKIPVDFHTDNLILNLIYGIF